MSLSKQNIGIIVLFIFYTVGVIGLSIQNYTNLFLKLTPLNLYLTLFLYLLGTGFTQKNLKAFLAVFAFGIAIEAIGVASGVLFGVYSYGATLGYKVMAVPLTIGVNWFILSAGTRGIIQRFIHTSVLQIICSALLMVGLDYLIEPIAVKFDFWSWQSNVIPLQNYLMWFVAAIIAQVILTVFKVKLDFRMSLVLILLQFAFFGILNLTVL